MKKKTRKKAKPSTALVRRKPVALTPMRKATLVTTPAPSAALAPLTDDIDLGALALVEVKFTPEEEQVCNEAVQLRDVSIKPTGQPYLAHPVYTRWMNRAFGRTGWGMRPAAKPMKSGNSVVQPYVLYIHGKPVAFANGEQEYHDNNAEQTYGDALEATVASALRRCMKRLGIGLELWDRDWIDNFMAEHGLHVQIEVKKRGTEGGTYNKWVWRKRGSAPFWNEVKKGSSRHRDDDSAEPAQRQPREAAPPDPSHGHHAQSTDKINDAQVKRLGVIIHNSGRSPEEIQPWMERRYGFKLRKDITRDKYDAICSAIESPRDLP